MRFEEEVTKARLRLRAFNDCSSCYACGSNDISAFFRKKGEREWGDLMERLMGISTSFVPFSILVRQCSRCRRQWAELPLNESEAK